MEDARRVADAVSIADGGVPSIATGCRHENHYATHPIVVRMDKRTVEDVRIL